MSGRAFGRRKALQMLSRWFCSPHERLGIVQPCNSFTMIIFLLKDGWDSCRALEPGRRAACGAKAGRGAWRVLAAPAGGVPGSSTQSDAEGSVLWTSLEAAVRLIRTAFRTATLVGQGSRGSRAGGEVLPAHLQILAVPTFQNFDSGSS